MPDIPLKLFVNYRRADEAMFVELLRTHFMFRYGRENVFMDFDSIPPFTRFEEYIRSKVRECDVLVSVIGPRWLDLLRAKEAGGGPDYVRIELTEALRLGKVIAPILIQGAKVPPEDQIPADLRDLFSRNIPSIGGGRDLLNNVGWLMDNFERELREGGVTRAPAEPERAVGAAGATTEHLTLDELIERFDTAEAADDFPAALLWAAEIRANGSIVPRFYKLDEREAVIRDRLYSSEERRRRMEVAETLYKFVRAIAKRNASLPELAEAFEEVWAIEPGYDPDRLSASLRPRTPSPTERGQGGEVIGGRVEDLLPPPFEWCNIPAGRVTVEEVGDFDVQPFRMAKYPITNAQFNIFLNDPNGYAKDKWWDFSKAARDWHAENNKALGSPDDLDSDKQPRVYVNWYEAMAFCRWLSDRSGERITLPTEVQWQHAAQGERGLTYPWGNEFDAGRCNTYESGIGRTTPVDQYPTGASPYGVMGMSGNVWEWCLSVWETPDGTNVDGNAPRVLRGGSRNDYQSVARAVFRFSFDPDLRLNYIGFRVVVGSSPI